jgi:SAM-dependent methyltransferase
VREEKYFGRVSSGRGLSAKNPQALIRPKVTQVVKVDASPLFRPIDVRRHNRAAILRLAAQYARPGGTVYDIGCGDKPFAPTVRALGCTYIGVDIAEGFYKEKPDLIGTAIDVPAPDESADIIISSQVLEHLEDPLAALREAFRLLRPGGVMIISFPFLYPVHAAPYDFGRYTRYFILSAAPRLGYEILQECSYAGYWRVRAMSLAIYWQSLDRGLLRHLRLVPALIAIQQWFCVGMHSLERTICKLTGRNPDNIWKSWPVNSIFALGKKGVSAETGM